MKVEELNKQIKNTHDLLINDLAEKLPSHIKLFDAQFDGRPFSIFRGHWFKLVNTKTKAMKMRTVPKIIMGDREIQKEIRSVLTTV